MDLEKLLEKIEAYNPTADLELIRRAYFFAAKAHAGQFRVSGDPILNIPGDCFYTGRAGTGCDYNCGWAPP